MAISGLVGAIYKASGTSAAFTAKPMTNSGDNMRYFITDTTVRYWDNSAIVTVEKSTDSGTTWVTVTSGFTIEYAGGNVVFTVSQGTALFRVTGKNFVAVNVGGGFKWTLDVQSSVIESTNFDSAGWKEYTDGVNEFSGSFEKYWSDGANFSDLANELLIIILYIDAGANKTRYEGYAIFKNDKFDTSVSGLITESLDFQGKNKFYYRVG